MSEAVWYGEPTCGVEEERVVKLLLLVFAWPLALLAVILYPIV